MAYLDLMELPGQMDSLVAQDLLDRLALLVKQERTVHQALQVHLVVKVYPDLPEMKMDYQDLPAHLALMARQELQAHLVHLEHQVQVVFRVPMEVLVFLDLMVHQDLQDLLDQQVYLDLPAILGCLALPAFLGQMVTELVVL